MNLSNAMKRRWAALRRDEDGGMTAFGLTVFTVGAMVGAFALDVSYLNATRTQLQIAADQAAHAALYNRGRRAADGTFVTADAARKTAQDVITTLLPETLYGDALPATSIEFGTFDRASGTFSVDNTSSAAVRVSTSLTANKQNAAKTYLFRMIGIDAFDVGAQSIYMTYRPGCLREGFVADGVVDMQSNSSFTKGFCIHSNTHVSFNQNNFFEAGTIVSMPNLDDLDLPKSGFEKNEGLFEALRRQKTNIRIIDRIDGIIAGLQTSDPVVMPDYITNTSVRYMNEKNLDMSELTVGRVHYVDCTGPRLNIDGATATIHDVVIISPCEIKFANNSALEDAIVASTWHTADSINAPQNLRLGRDDNCAEGGGAQLLTEGGMIFAAGLQMFGGQIMAKKDVEFAANADGLQGASILAGGRIDGTSNADMGFCGSGMEDNFEIDYYRMAR